MTHFKRLIMIMDREYSPSGFMVAVLPRLQRVWVRGRVVAMGFSLFSKVEWSI